MTTTITSPPKTYVVCETFCGLPISHPGREDHADDCGATDADIARIDTELAILLAKNANAATAEVQPEPKPLNGYLDGETRKGTVDGKDANIHHGEDPAKPKPADKPKKKDLSHLWKEPALKIAWVFEMQAKIDRGEILLGGIMAGKACIGKMTALDHEDGATVEVSCPHKSAVRSVLKSVCSREKKHTETLAQVCFVHGIIGLGSGEPVAGLGPLFGPQDDHDDEHEHEHAES